MFDSKFVQDSVMIERSAAVIKKSAQLFKNSEELNKKSAAAIQTIRVTCKNVMGRTIISRHEVSRIAGSFMSTNN